MMLLVRGSSESYAERGVKRACRASVAQSLALGVASRQRVELS